MEKRSKSVTLAFDEIKHGKAHKIAQESIQEQLKTLQNHIGGFAKILKRESKVWKTKIWKQKNSLKLEK